MIATSPHADAVVPHLSEAEARLLTRKVVECLHGLGVFPRSVGVDLDTDGFWFTADVNGRLASARTGQGHFTYAQVAREIQLASIDPTWDRLMLKKGS